MNSETYEAIQQMDEEKQKELQAYIASGLQAKLTQFEGQSITPEVKAAMATEVEKALSNIVIDETVPTGIVELRAGKGGPIIRMDIQNFGTKKQLSPTVRRAKRAAQKQARKRSRS